MMLSIAPTWILTEEDEFIALSSHLVAQDGPYRVYLLYFAQISLRYPERAMQYASAMS